MIGNAEMRGHVAFARGCMWYISFILFQIGFDMYTAIHLTCLIYILLQKLVLIREFVDISVL
jgi:hypothetical protein